jgi:hypothetical protein
MRLGHTLPGRSPWLKAQALLALAAAMVTGCAGSSPSSQRHSPVGTPAGVSHPSFSVVGVYRQTPPGMPADLKRYWVATLPSNQLAFRFPTATGCQRGPLKMPVATPSRIAFKMTIGCTDDQREVTFIVALRGLKIDRAKPFTLQLMFPHPIGTRTLKLPPA